LTFCTCACRPPHASCHPARRGASARARARQLGARGDLVMASHTKLLENCFLHFSYWQQFGLAGSRDMPGTPGKTSRGCCARGGAQPAPKARLPAPRARLSARRGSEWRIHDGPRGDALVFRASLFRPSLRSLVPEETTVDAEAASTSSGPGRRARWSARGEGAGSRGDGEHHAREWHHPAPTCCSGAAAAATPPSQPACSAPSARAAAFTGAWGVPGNPPAQTARSGSPPPRPTRASPRQRQRQR
jgi:hypothetical protein